MHADLLLTGGRVLTSAGHFAEALAVQGAQVLAVGRAADLAQLRGPRTRVLELAGRLAVPGFTDSHLHLRELARSLSALDLRRARTREQALRRVAARARRTPPGRWITGGGFDKNLWGDAFPTRHHLDRAAPDHPVALASRDGHSLWVNSAALRLCGITRRTRAPAGGVIVRDSRGGPTGILQETATRLVYQSPAYEAGPPDLGRALRRLLREGVTSMHLMGESDLLGELAALRAGGRLPIRATIYPGQAALDDMIAEGVRSGHGDEWVRIGGLKLLVDGALGSQTAWLFAPYENREAGCGVPVLHGRELRDVVARAAQAGIACAIHAIGDRANAEALDALQAAAQWPTPLPHRIEHAQLLRPQDVGRFARLGVVASMQPCHILGDIEPAERYWGRRSRWAYPVRSLLRTGATLAFGSDAPVETTSVVAGLYAAVCRQTLDGRPRGGWYVREEGIGPAAALRCYTAGPAAATGEAALKGRLAPGRLADIVVLSRPVTRLRGRALLEAQVDLVVVGGRVRYRRHGVR